MNLSHLIITFTAISISGCTVDSTQEKPTSEGPLDLYGTQHKIILESKTKPQGKAANGFKEFKKGGKSGHGYYGAFAYSINPRKSSVYGSHTGYNSLKTAREGALAGCKSYLKKGEAPCKIIAVMVPKGYVNKQKITLSKSVTKLLRDQKNKGEYRAFATNDGDYARVWNRETQELANQEALENCNTRAKRETPRHQKLYPCRLIPEEQ